MLSLAQQPLLIGAWIGLIHAFDADHVSTLGNLALRGRSRFAYGYAVRWACGHAVALGALGALALGVGVLWIANLSQLAETMVACLLIALGLNSLASCRRQHRQANTGHPHTGGLLMGLLHGGAGSAAVLAILPLAGMDSGLAAFRFLAAFSVGVATGALLFAALFSGLLVRTARSGDRLQLAVTAVVGAIAVVAGGAMLFGALHAG